MNKQTDALKALEEFLKIARKQAERDMDRERFMEALEIGLPLLFIVLSALLFDPSDWTYVAGE